MVRPLAFPLSFLAAAYLFAQDELPTNPVESLDIEPPLLIQNVPTQKEGPSASVADSKSDPDQLLIALESARKNVVSGERLFRRGIIAKVEAENRTLKVVRLESASNAAAAAADRRHKAELDQALLNLSRQKKLLALGSGRKSEVTRAEEKV